MLVEVVNRGMVAQQSLADWCLLLFSATHSSDEGEKVKDIILFFPLRGQQSAWHSAQETPIPMQGQIRFQIAWIKKFLLDCSDVYCIWPECPGGY